jgi:hypothetical protein
MKRMAARLTTIDESTRNELLKLCSQTAEGYGQLEQKRQPGATLVARNGITEAEDSGH